MLFWILVVLGILLLLAGLAGCIVPVLPGPPLSYLGLVSIWGARGWDAEVLGWEEMLILGVATAIVTLFDMYAPIWGARRYGASSAGIWCSVLGLLIGLFFFPPLGMLIGAFLGALVGELLVGKKDREAWRAAWGTFVGTMAGIVLKLAVCVVITFYFVWELVA